MAHAGALVEIAAPVKQAGNVAGTAGLRARVLPTAGNGNERNDYNATATERP